MCGIAGLIHRGKTGDIGQEMTAMLQSLKHRGPDFDRLRPLRQAEGRRARAALQGRRAGRHEEGLRHPPPGEGAPRRGRPPPGGAGRRDRRGGGGDRVCLPLPHQVRRRSPQARRLHRGRRGRRDPLDRPWPRADQGPGRCHPGRRPVPACAASSARMPSAIPAWRRNPTSTSARPIPTGPIRSPTCRSCTTASSPTTGRAAARSSTAAIASCRTAIPS